MCITTIVIIILLALFVLAVWKIWKYIAKRKKEIEDTIAAYQQKIVDLSEEIEQIKQDNRDKEVAEQQEKEVEKKEEERRKQKAEQKRLTELMRTKNLLPRLQCKDNSGTFTYNVKASRTTIGRKGYRNDLELNNDNVSRSHAEIVFTGGGFEIIDTNSTHKVIVNGLNVERATLKSSDVIGLGEAVITFFV